MNIKANNIKTTTREKSFQEFLDAALLYTKELEGEVLEFTHELVSATVV